MWPRSGSGQQNVIVIAIAMLLLGVVLGLMLGSRWPVFIIFFWFGPWLFRSLRHQRERGWWQADSEQEKAKRKVDAPADADLSQAAPQSEPARYLLTDDGEVMEIVDAPETPEVDALDRKQHD